MRLDVLAYVKTGATTAEAAAEVLQPAIRTQLQVEFGHRCTTQSKTCTTNDA